MGASGVSRAAVSLCPAVLCPGGQKYQECAPVCGKKCGEPEDYGELGSCVAGYHCSLGLLWDPEGQCVPPACAHASLKPVIMPLAVPP